MKTFSKPGFSKRLAPRTRATYAARSAGRGFDQPERFQAECASCHARCEVPFKPNGKKPVYCRDCYRANEGAAPERAAPSRYAAIPREDGATDLKKQFSILNTKLDRLTAAIEEQTRVLSEGR